MLKVNNITRQVENFIILDKVNFKARCNEITAIIGPSGSGKTSLLRCLAHLDPIQEGELIFCETPLKKLASGEIGLVFQNFHLFPHLTILQNLTLASLAQGFDKQQVINQAYTLLEQFSLQAKDNAYPNQLSGGQKQRIAIARALMMNPPILLFDEPTSALDPEMIKEVAQIIKETQNENRVILIVTHEIRLAQNIADQILFFDRGLLLDNMTAESFFTKNNPNVSLRAQKFLANFT